ncbi:hypothetical protein VNO80_01375 [Phaseolus coccineus]|uniref:Serine-threonine/tyrosine-protein kinase catalytic domain-containing protein n=1 Tax=Phaseolus coccineus TaxID=3886 RepID=A0AAN9WYW8_PHACN
MHGLSTKNVEIVHHQVHVFYRRSTSSAKRTMVDSFTLMIKLASSHFVLFFTLTLFHQSFYFTRNKEWVGEGEVGEVAKVGDVDNGDVAEALDGDKSKTKENIERQLHVLDVTFGYMAPEYAVDGLYSIKSDVFSFGILLLEIICGNKNRALCHGNQTLNLVGYDGVQVHVLEESGFWQYFFVKL